MDSHKNPSVSPAQTATLVSEYQQKIKRLEKETIEKIKQIKARYDERQAKRLRNS